MSGVSSHPRALLATAAAIGVANWVGIALAPSLLSEWPLVLVALSPIPRHVVLAATIAPPLGLTLVGAARRMATSLLGFYIARFYGLNGVSAVKARYPKLAPALEWLESAFRHAGPLLLFVAPGPLVSALAGATRMRPSLFVPTAALAHAFWMVVTYRVGSALSGWIAPIMRFIDAHKLELTLACVLLVLLYTWRRRRSQRDALRDLTSAAAAHAEAAGLPPGER